MQLSIDLTGREVLVTGSDTASRQAVRRYRAAGAVVSRLSSPSGSRHDGPLPGAVAAFDDGHRHVRAHPGPAQSGGELVQRSDPHQHHDRAAQPGEVHVLLLGQRGVARDHGEHVADLAVRDRDPGCGRDGDGTRNTGDHADGNSGLHTGGHFLAAAAEHVRVAALEPHHVLSGQGGLDHEFLDPGLADRVVAGALTHVHQLGRAQGGQFLVRGQPVVEDDVRVPQGLDGGDRQQFGGSRAASDQGDVAGGAGGGFHGDRDAGFAAAVQQRIPAGLAVVDGSHEERTLGQRPVVARALRGAEA